MRAPLTAWGVAWSPKEPLPSRPSPPNPQQKAAPAAVNPQVCSAPALIVTKSSICMGLSRLLNEPWPSWPFSPLPQQ